MFDCFGDKPDFSPVVAVANEWAVDELIRKSERFVIRLCTATSWFLGKCRLTSLTHALRIS